MMNECDGLTTALRQSDVALRKVLDLTATWDLNDARDAERVSQVWEAMREGIAGAPRALYQHGELTRRLGLGRFES